MVSLQLVTPILQVPNGSELLDRHCSGDTVCQMLVSEAHAFPLDAIHKQFPTFFSIVYPLAAYFRKLYPSY